ncbi:type VI secretion system protein TssA [Marinibaculum pumilum]|uniref:Type VI secretion system protein TssA n=1 Tax=Marinibaculum pumilum TaxID=1766165 RepID=A0ABV7L4F1_9PROT
MAEAAQVVDLEKILTPIPGESPAGRSLFYEPVYDDIKEARREDNPDLPTGVWQKPLKVANWSNVIDRCAKALAKDSKDLQLAAWLTEAMGKAWFLDGLQHGFRIIAGISDRFWEGMFPEIDDDDDLEARERILEWMDEQLPFTLLFMPITDPGNPMAEDYTWIQWRDAVRREQALAANKAVDNADDESIPTKDKILQSVALTGLPFLKARLAEIADTQAALKEMSDVLDAKFGKYGAPALRKVGRELDELKMWFDQELAKRPEEEEEPEAEEEPAPAPDDAAVPAEGEAAPEAPAAGATARTVKSGGAFRLASRDDAYAMLKAATDYLMEADPHSPTPYLVRRAIAFRDMSFTDLLEELVDDERQRNHLFRLMGLGEGGSPTTD